MSSERVALGSCSVRFCVASRGTSKETQGLKEMSRTTSCKTPLLQECWREKSESGSLRHPRWSKCISVSRTKWRWASSESRCWWPWLWCLSSNAWRPGRVWEKTILILFSSPQITPASCSHWTSTSMDSWRKSARRVSLGGTRRKFVKQLRSPKRLDKAVEPTGLCDLTCGCPRSNHYIAAGQSMLRFCFSRSRACPS